MMADCPEGGSHTVVSHNDFNDRGQWVAVVFCSKCGYYLASDTDGTYKVNDSGRKR